MQIILSEFKGKHYFWKDGSSVDEEYVPNFENNIVICVDLEDKMLGIAYSNYCAPPEKLISVTDFIKLILPKKQ
jgi:hypothetical protein